MDTAMLFKRKYLSFVFIGLAALVFVIWQRGTFQLSYSPEFTANEDEYHGLAARQNYGSSDSIYDVPRSRIGSPLLNSSFHSGRNRPNPINRIWPIQHSNCLSNFFYQDRPHLALNHYRTSNLVFVHHNKAGGSTLRSCFEEIAPSSHVHLGSLLVSYKHVVKVYEQLHRQEGVGDFRVGLMGGYSFGVCDALNNDRQCSYFTMLRDPYERVISCYFFCQKSSKDQLCTSLKATEVTLKEWALHQGSFFFNQLLINPRVCQGTYDQYFNLEGTQYNFWHDPEPPCWFKQKVILQNYLNNDQMDQLLNYCVDNLESWFSVIGMIDEFNLSLSMYQHVLGIPFSDTCTGKHFQVGRYKKKRKANDTDQNANVDQLEKEKMIQNLKAELQADPEVQAALHADLVLYQKAREIYNKQKDVFLKIQNGYS